MKKKELNKILILVIVVIILGMFTAFAPLTCSNSEECEKTWRKPCSGDWICIGEDCKYYCNEDLVRVDKSMEIEEVKKQIMKEIEKKEEKVEEKEEKVEEKKAPKKPKGDLILHFLDLSYGDATFINTPNKKKILIDGGPKEMSVDLVKYMMANEGHPVDDQIDMILGSVMDNDNIGGLGSVLYTYLTIGKVYDNDREITGSAYKNFNTLGNTKDRIVVSEDTTIDIDDSIKMELIVAYEELKSVEDEQFYSILTRITYLNTSFLLASDCNQKCEEIILQDDIDLSADILKVANIANSTSEEFLNRVNPKVAIVFGKEGSKDVMERLEEKDVTVLKTGLEGHIVVQSDGESYSILA